MNDAHNLHCQRLEVTGACFRSDESFPRNNYNGVERRSMIHGSRHEETRPDFGGRMSVSWWDITRSGTSFSRRLSFFARVPHVLHAQRPL